MPAQEETRKVRWLPVRKVRTRAVVFPAAPVASYCFLNASTNSQR